MGERTPEEARDYRLKNLDRRLESDRKYRETYRNGNPEFLEQARLRNKAYYEKNKEELSERRSQIKAEHRFRVSTWAVLFNFT